MVEELVRARAHRCHPSIGVSLATSLFVVKGARTGRLTRPPASPDTSQSAPRQGRTFARASAAYLYYAQRTRRFQVAAVFTSQCAAFRILPRALPNGRPPRGRPA